MILPTISRISKEYQNIRIPIPTKLGNETVILLYSKVPNSPSCSDTRQYHSKSHSLIFGTRKDQSFFKEINRIWKKLQNYKSPMICYHHKQVKHRDNVFVYHGTLYIELHASIKSITLYTQFHQVTKIIENLYIFIKVH